MVMIFTFISILPIQALLEWSQQLKGQIIRSVSTKPQKERLHPKSYECNNEYNLKVYY